MDTTNNHDKGLVERINKVWNDNNNWWEWTLIVGALMHRDGTEILEKLDMEIAAFADDEMMVRVLGGDYLMQIADDTDLRIILDFVRG